MQAADIVNLKVGKLRMIAQCPWRQRVAAISGHDQTVVAAKNPPTRIWDLEHLDTQDINEPAH
jgi:hypothetical protein